VLLAVPAARLPAMPATGGSRSNSPTESAALRIISENLMRDIETIEASAAEAAEGCGDIIRKSLLAYVTQRKKPPVDLIPCGRRQFYAIRRRFFVALDRRRVGEG